MRPSAEQTPVLCRAARVLRVVRRVASLSVPGYAVAIMRRHLRCNMGAGLHRLATLDQRSATGGNHSASTPVARFSWRRRSSKSSNQRFSPHSNRVASFEERGTVRGCFRPRHRRSQRFRHLSNLSSNFEDLWPRPAGGSSVASGGCSERRQIPAV